MKVRTMLGVDLDITTMMAQHEHLVATGNAKMNARGDLLGPGGKVIKRREQAAQEYYQSNPRAVQKVSLRDIKPDMIFQPAEAVKAATPPAKKSRKIIDSE